MSINSKTESLRSPRLRIKRLLDVTVAAAALITLSPVLLVTSVLVAVNLGRPVFFTQVRPGLRGRPFRIIKFRSMRDALAADGTPLPDDQRLTRFGRLLRSTSLDELPELWNVLRGEMSLVGPRPLITAYLDRYTPHQARRHEMRPGITGLAQVNGRNALSWEDRFDQDVWYVDNHSLWLDAKILWLTVMTVVKREGITAEGHASMPEFMGPGNSRSSTT